MVNNIALGTVQFGLNYGINNNNGKVSSQKASEIIEICRENNIDYIDTARGYGTSEEILGKIGVTNFKVISKFSTSDSVSLSTSLDQSLKKLKIVKIYGYMFHSFPEYEKDKRIWTELKSLKEKGIIEKIGVSLYSPDQLDVLMNDNIDIDIIQAPYNIFDRRFEISFEILKSRGVEIHTRSAFLQGLFFKQIDQLPQFFSGVRQKLINLRKIGKLNNLSITELCLGFAMSNPSVDKIVIGVDTPEQLLNNIKSIQIISKSFKREILDGFGEKNINIINPSLWKI